MNTLNRIIRCAIIACVVSILALIVGIGEASYGIVVAIARAVRDGARMVKEVTGESWADR